MSTTPEQLAATISARRAVRAGQLTRANCSTPGRRCARSWAEGHRDRDRQPRKRPSAKKSADFYHLLVLLESRGVAIGDVLGVLAKRSGVSGLKEKAERGKR
jgi:phosphoribosyl-ATP pyrophosphohydrolase